MIFEANIREVRNVPDVVLQLGKDFQSLITGVGLSALSIINLGADSEINFKASYKNQEAVRVLVTVYFGVIKVLNPACKSEYHISLDHEFPVFVGIGLQGFSDDLIQKALKSDRWLQREVVSRGLILRQSVMLSIASVADLAIGLFFAIASIVILGRVEIFHIIAVKQLPLNIISQVCFAARYIVNPHQK